MSIHSIDSIFSYRGWCLDNVCSTVFCASLSPLFTILGISSFVGLGEDPQVLSIRAPALFGVCFTVHKLVLFLRNHAEITFRCR